MPKESLNCPNCGSSQVKELKENTYICEACQSTFRWTDPSRPEYKHTGQVVVKHGKPDCDFCLEEGRFRVAFGKCVVCGRSCCRRHGFDCAGGGDIFEEGSEVFDVSDIRWELGERCAKEVRREMSTWADQPTNDEKEANEDAARAAIDAPYLHKRGRYIYPQHALPGHVVCLKCPLQIDGDELCRSLGTCIVCGQMFNRQYAYACKCCGKGPLHRTCEVYINLRRRRHKHGEGDITTICEHLRYYLREEKKLLGGPYAPPRYSLGGDVWEPVSMEDQRELRRFLSNRGTGC